MKCRLNCRRDDQIAVPDLLIGITDEAGQRIRAVTYDPQGRVTISEIPGTNMTQPIIATGWGYNNKSLPISVVETTTPAGSTVSGVTGSWTYAYNSKSEVVRRDWIVPELQTVIYNLYDRHGRPVSGTGADGRTFNFTYRLDGQVSNLRLSDDYTVTYVYGSQGLLAYAIGSDGGITQPIYDNIGDVYQLMVNDVVLSKATEINQDRSHIFPTFHKSEQNLTSGTMAIVLPAPPQPVPGASIAPLCTGTKNAVVCAGVGGFAVGTLLYPLVEPGVSKIVDAVCLRDTSDCDKEWEDAFRQCKKWISQQDPRRGVTGGYGNLFDCARGLVSERCGGNPLDWGKNGKKGRK